LTLLAVLQPTASDPNSKSGLLPLDKVCTTAITAAYNIANKLSVIYIVTIISEYFCSYIDISFPSVCPPVCP